MPDSQQDIQAKLKALLDNYCNQLPERQKDIESHWQMVCEQQAMGEQGKELYRLVHSLAGSGASFGFAELSKAAKAFELKIKTYCDDARSLDHQAQAELMVLRDKLYQALQDANHANKG